MILYCIVNRTEASKLMLSQSRQTNLATTRHSLDMVRVVLSFEDTDGIPSEFVGREHYTHEDIVVELQKPEWQDDL